YFNRQRAAVKPALERLDFQSHSVVVNTVARVDTRVCISRRVVKPNAWRKIVFVSAARSLEKRENEWIQLIDAADVLHISVEFVSQSEIQREIQMDSPIVLNKTRQIGVVCIREKQRTLGKTAAESHGKQ